MSLDRYRSLESLARGGLVSTSQAAARLRVGLSQASRLLRTLDGRGLAMRIRPGLWHVGDAIPDRLAIVTALTDPAPSYVSFLSALSHRGVIDQIPMEIAVASIGHPRTITTSLGTYVVHRIAPEVFGGWIEEDGRMVATTAKALFDIAYISAARKRPVSVPELDLPDDFDPSEAAGWSIRIPSRQLRTLTDRTLQVLLRRARA